MGATRPEHLQLRSCLLEVGAKIRMSVIASWGQSAEGAIVVWQHCTCPSSHGQAGPATFERVLLLVPFCAREVSTRTSVPVGCLSQDSVDVEEYLGAQQPVVLRLANYELFLGQRFQSRDAVIRKAGQSAAEYVAKM